MCASANETAFATFSTFIYTYDLLTILLYIIMELTGILASIKETEKSIAEQKIYVNSLKRELDNAEGDLYTLENTLEFEIKALNEARQEQIQQQLGDAVDLSEFKKKMDDKIRKDVY